jgi:hypothetical protein
MSKTVADSSGKINLSVAEVEELLLGFVSNNDDDDEWHEWHEWESLAKKEIWKKAFPDDIEPGYDYKTSDGGKWRAWRQRYSDFFKNWEPKLYVTVPDLGRVRVAEQFGGEGQGDQYYMVFEVVFDDDTTRHFTINGWYASYDGGYYDGPLVEVKPVQKVVTFYE